MIYPFECEPCGHLLRVDSKPFHPPAQPICESCGAPMQRVYGCEINTSSCRDHDDIPAASRVVRAGSIRSGRDVNAVREEQRFHKHIQDKRKLYKEAGVNPDFRHANSIPADLYHGKIRETGDKNYWSDAKNLSRHPSTKVT